jgi:hypothetical protein
VTADPVLWTLKEAAEAARVSPSYLRLSDCHRVYLPSTRPGGRPLLRFRPDDVRAWADAHSTKLRIAS